MEAFWWDWLWGKLGLFLMDGAMLSKNLIQFSVDGWGCVLFLLFDLRSNYDGGNEDNGDLLQKVPCTQCCTQCPRLCNRPPLTHASAGNSWTLMGKSGSVSCWITAPFYWVLVHTRIFFFCPLQRSVSPVLCKFWWIYGGVNGDLLKEGLCRTQVCCTQSPCSVAGHWRTDIPQDGRIEGCVLIFSCENSKITTFCWTTIDRMLDPTKKRTPTFKGKGETTECQ